MTAAEIVKAELVTLVGLAAVLVVLLIAIAALWLRENWPT